MYNSYTKATSLSCLHPQNVSPALQWWWHPILWDIELQYCWISCLLNQNKIPPRIIHNCILLLLVSLLYLLFYGADIMQIIFFIPVNITVTVQSIILLPVYVICIEVVLVPRALQKIRRKIHTFRIFYIIIPTCIIPILQSRLMIFITNWCYILIVIRRVCIVRDNDFQRQCMAI